MSIHTGLQELNIGQWVELPRRAPGETHLVLPQSNDVLALCRWASQNGYYLCTLAACDERMLEDHAFKLYIILSDLNHQLVILEHPLAQDSNQFSSLREHFPSAIPLERAARDLYGLTASNATPEGRFLLHHGPYPPDLYPLRRNRGNSSLSRRISQYQSQSETNRELPYGILNLVVGPIHAGIIEAGQFRFYVAGEVVEDLTINLGYKHRGIEKLFETSYTLTTGQRLAERISGDSSFAHSLAYCQAIESLVDAPLPYAAACWRGLLLEMERLYNHLGDVAALVHDIAYDLVAAELAVLRERVVRLNMALSGHRLLHGVNHPGGVTVAHPELAVQASREAAEIAAYFLGWVDKHVLSNSVCRNRYLATGVLTRAEAQAIGATGLPARASGLWQHDFRLCHPYGAYALDGLGDQLRRLVSETFIAADGDALPSQSSRRAPVYHDDLTGDVFARLLVRAAEIETSAKIIERLGQELQEVQTAAASAPMHIAGFSDLLQEIDNFEIGLGYVEGWRGDIFYFVMTGPGNTIFRCQPRDPSLYNWPALRLAVIRKQQTGQAGGRHAAGPAYWENTLADFPVINMSFNLSCAGNDC